MKKITFILTCFIMASCGHKYYTNSNFDSITANHKNIAVLPVDLKLTGTKPV